MNSIIMSIRPEWSEKILNGIKTEEIRKNLGKLTPPFKVYGYVTKGNPTLYRLMTYQKEWFTSIPDGWIVDCLDKGFNGKVCFEFVVDKCEFIEYDELITCDKNQYEFHTSSMDENDLLQACCLSQGTLWDYYFEKGKVGAYSLHISELKVYDKPRELGEFSHYKKKTISSFMGEFEPYTTKVLVPLTRAFQSWGYVEEKQDE